MIKIVDYSPQSIVIIGDTFALKDKIKEIGGVFSKSLTVDGTKTSGWVFPKTKKDEIETFIQNLPQQIQSKVTRVENTIKAPISIDPKITHEMFSNLLNKYEMLEARVEYLEGQLLKDDRPATIPVKQKEKKKPIKIEESSESDEEEIVPTGRPRRLLG